MTARSRAVDLVDGGAEPAVSRSDVVSTLPGRQAGAGFRVPTGARGWRLPATENSVTVLRRRLNGLLREADLPDDERYDVVLAVCEAATNAVEHAWAPDEPFVEVAVELGDSQVTISVRDHGTWREPAVCSHPRRGLAMMWGLADTTIATGHHGTTVTIRSRPRKV
jgi:anti-sigma regulatory factor (Ser/Thr protein kinase)